MKKDSTGVRLTSELLTCILGYLLCQPALSRSLLSNEPNRILAAVPSEPSPQDLLAGSGELLALTSSLYKQVHSEPAAAPRTTAVKSGPRVQAESHTASAAGASPAVLFQDLNGQDVKRLQEQAVVRPPAYPLFKRVRDVQLTWQERAETEVLLAVSAESQANVQLWFWLSAASVLAVFGVLLIVAARGPKAPEDPRMDPSEYGARGRFCWNYVCVGLAVLLAWGTFTVTVATIDTTNALIAENPIINTTIGGQEVEEMRFPMNNTGVRAFEATQGVSMSLLVAGLVLLAWHKDGPVPMTSSLVLQFMLRGGSLALVIALILEMLGQGALQAAGLDGYYLLGTGLMMFIVGMAEEFGKLVAVACGTLLSVEALIADRSSRNCCSCTCCCGAALADSPRMLVIGGLAAGFGFMTVENAGYVLAAAATPPTLYPDEMPAGKEIKPEDMNGRVTSVMTVVLIVIRVLLNIHPWCAGISAARLAKVAFQDESKAACVSISVLLWAIFPSAIIHGLFDFLVTVLPTIITLPMPLIFWYGARAYFIRQWPEPSLVEAQAQARRLEADAGGGHA